MLYSDSSNRVFIRRVIWHNNTLILYYRTIIRERERLIESTIIPVIISIISIKGMMEIGEWINNKEREVEKGI
jgi:hypothetical protein